MKLGVLAIKMIRFWLKRSDKKNYAKETLPDGIKATYDVDALGDGVFCHQVDVYLAPEEKRIHKTILDIHGGAYVYGTRKNNKTFAGVFLEKGYDVVTMDYPLNGQRGIDCRTQLTVLANQLIYVAQHAEELDINKDDISIVGDSAGGHHALLLAEMVCDPALAAKFGIDFQRIKIKAVAVNCPVYDFARLTADPKLVSKRGKRFLYGPAYVDPDYVSLVDPKQNLDSLKVPCFVSSCTKDFLCQESKDLASDLDAKGYPHEFIFVESEDPDISHIHNVVHIHHPESIRVNEAMGLFFKSR